MNYEDLLQFQEEITENPNLSDEEFLELVEEHFDTGFRERVEKILENRDTDLREEAVYQAFTQRRYYD